MADDETPAPETEAQADPSAAPEGEAPPPPEAEGEPKGARDYSRQFAALGRKASAVRDREAELAKREQALGIGEKERQELETYRQLRQQARHNPRAWLEAGALDRETTSKAWAERPQPSAEVTELREQMAQMAKRLEEQEAGHRSHREAQAKASIVDNISRHIESQSAEYELLHAEKAYGDVYELMDRYYQQHGTVLPVKDACSAMESALVDQRVADAQRIRGYKKLAPRLGWQAPEEDQPAETPPAAPAKQSKPKQSRRDLPATSPTKAKRVVSDEEAWQELQRRFTQG